MIDFIIHDNGRPGDRIEPREFPFLTGSMLERTGTVQDGGHPRLFDDAAFAVRAVAVAVILILSVGLTRPIRDPSRERVAMVIADLTGDGALTQVESA